MSTNTLVLKPKELSAVMQTAIKENFNVLTTGSPGVGKTDILKEAVSKQGCDLIIEHAVTSEPTDYKGLGFPTADRESAKFLPYGSLQTMITADKPLVVFFDDIGQAPQSVQAAIMQLILERRINGHKISKHVRFLAATNRRQDNAAVTGLITPLISRFASIVELEADAASWTEWALRPENDMPLELIAFLRLKPTLISTFDSSKRDLKNFACPRTIANLGKWVKAGIHDVRVWTGCVGEAFAIEFAAFWQLYKTLGNLPDMICQGIKADVPEKPDLKFALCAALAFRASPVNWKNIMEYAKKLPSEFQTFIVCDAGARHDTLLKTKEYIAYAVENQDVL